MGDNLDQQIRFLGDNQTDAASVLVSTLVKVTEQLLTTVNVLNQTSDKSKEEKLVSVMEHYERLNMVIRVLKLAYPVLLQSSNEKDAMDYALKQASTAAINSLSKIGEQQNQLVQNNPLQISGSTQVLPQELVQKDTPAPKESHLSRDIQTRDIQTPRDVLIPGYTPSPKEVKVQQRPVVEKPHPPQKTSLKVKSEDMMAGSAPAAQINKKDSTNISSSVFLDQFENMARTFATQNKMDMSDVWESLFVHALPQDKIKWAEITILNKSLNWNTARRVYLKTYPDIHIQQPIKQFTSNEPRTGLSASVTEAATRINQTTAPTMYMSQEEKKRMLERQSLYAERLLSLEMKGYDAIHEYNQKFHRFSNVACMNLNDVSLSKRYIHSLTPKYRLMVEKALASRTPPTLVETMRLAESLIQPQETNHKKIHGQVCWKHPNNQKKRSTGEDGIRPFKRSSCA